jgi:hypothetical protein
MSLLPYAAGNMLSGRPVQALNLSLENPAAVLGIVILDRAINRRIYQQFSLQKRCDVAD